MKRRILVLFIFFTFCIPTLASTWYVMAGGGHDEWHFFDADTIEKTKDKSVLIWVKKVNAERPDSNGSWETNVRWRVSCANKLIQRLAVSIYDQNEKLIDANSTLGIEQHIFPDSFGDALAKMTCNPLFPNDKLSNDYVRLIGNDPVQFVRRNTDPVPSGAIWYVMRWIGDENAWYFFDSSSVEKKKSQTVLMWIKVVQATKPLLSGNWATATKWRLDCVNKTILAIAMSGYDEKGKFIKSGDVSGKVVSITPNSVGEQIMQIACAPEFPNDRSTVDYYKLENNDPMLSTKIFEERRRESKEKISK